MKRFKPWGNTALTGLSRVQQRRNYAFGRAQMRQGFYISDDLKRLGGGIFGE